MSCEKHGYTSNVLCPICDLEAIHIYTIHTVEHPCYHGNGDWEHDWEEMDDSFDHEYGTEIILYDMCNVCGLQREAEHIDLDVKWPLE
jgi:hypothetical protein